MIEGQPFDSLGNPTPLVRVGSNVQIIPAAPFIPLKFLQFQTVRRMPGEAYRGGTGQERVPSSVENPWSPFGARSGDRNQDPVPKAEAPPGRGTPRGQEKMGIRAARHRPRATAQRHLFDRRRSANHHVTAASDMKMMEPMTFSRMVMVSSPT